MMCSGILTCERVFERESETKAWRDRFAGRRELLCGDNKIARLDIAACDLREIIVLQPGHHPNRRRLPVAQNPDFRLVGFDGARETLGDITERLVRHPDHVIAPVYDDAAGSRHT